MKASELIKSPIKIEFIYEMIENANKEGNFKHFIPHFVYVSEETLIRLGKDGFKIYKGDWDRHMIDCWIIEW